MDVDSGISAAVVQGCPLQVRGVSAPELQRSVSDCSGPTTSDERLTTETTCSRVRPSSAVSLIHDAGLLDVTKL